MWGDHTWYALGVAPVGGRRPVAITTIGPWYDDLLRTYGSLLPTDSGMVITELTVTTVRAADDADPTFSSSVSTVHLASNTLTHLTDRVVEVE